MVPEPGMPSVSSGTKEPVQAALLALSGAAIVAVALLTIAGWDAASPIAALVASLFGVGAGLGLFQVAYLEYVTGTLPPDDRGVAGSLTMVTRTVGVVSGATGLTLILVGYAPDGAAVAGAAFLAPFSATFMTIGSALLGFAVVWLDRPGPRWIPAFVGPGLCGGLTTFSAVQIEVLWLIDAGDAGLAGIYLGLSITASLMAASGAAALARRGATA